MSYLVRNDIVKNYENLEKEHTVLQNILKNVSTLLDEPAYENKDGVLNASPKILQDFQISLAGCITQTCS